MRIKEKRRKKIVIWLLVVAAMIAVSALLWWYLGSSPHKTQINGSEDSTINYKEPTDDQVKTGQDAKKHTIDSQPSGPPNAIAVSLNAIQNGNQVVFDTMIQDIVNQGACTLSVTSGSQTITKTSDIFANPSSSSCKGFSVQVNELPSGAWHAKLQVSSNNRSGEAATQLEVRW